MYKTACLLAADGLALQCFGTSPVWLCLPKGRAPAACLAAGKSAEAAGDRVLARSTARHRSAILN